jgi:hypothetical protein
VVTGTGGLTPRRSPVNDNHDFHISPHIRAAVLKAAGEVP